jgi:hypothetical protein
MISPVCEQSTNFSFNRLYYYKKKDMCNKSYLVERSDKQIAILDLNTYEYIYNYKFNVYDEPAKLKIFFKNKILYLCIIYLYNITLINVKTNQINLKIKLFQPIYDIFHIKNKYYIIAKNISYNFDNLKKIQVYNNIDKYDYVKYFNYNKKDLLIFYHYQKITIVDFFTVMILNNIELGINYSPGRGSCQQLIFWNSNYIFLFYKNCASQSVLTYDCILVDLFNENWKIIMEYGQPIRVMKYYDKKLGEIILYSFNDSTEINSYQYSTSSIKTLVNSEEISSLLYPKRLARKKKEEKEKIQSFRLYCDCDSYSYFDFDSLF